MRYHYPIKNLHLDGVYGMPISNISTLISSLEPVQQPGTYVFISVTDGKVVEFDRVVASIREPEGLSVVMAESDALALNLPILFRAAWITLNVNSDLQAVGLTAVFAAALSKAGLSCNVIAGACHDHIFVPFERADEALVVLRQLQASACTSAIS